MTQFIIGVIASLVAMALGAIVVKWGWPSVMDKFFYMGVRVDGSWEIIEERGGENRKSGRLELMQVGRRISGKSTRTITREGKTSHREFKYKGTISGLQMTLIFEDVKGIGFDTGTYVFIVQNDGKTMIGMSTFHGKKENGIVSELRVLNKLAS